MKVRTKVWLEKDGELVFGSGKARILRAVEQTGSLNAAAVELGMSYRHVWSSIRAAEERLGRPLLIRSKGGPGGGGAVLTPEAKRLMERLTVLSNETRALADKRFKELFRR